MTAQIRTVLSWGVLAVAVAAALALGNSRADAQPADPDTLARGGELYQRWCATCHATDASGTPDGPPLDTVSVAELDLTMRTGRMPLPDPERGVRVDELPPESRDAIVTYLTDLLDLDGDLVVPGDGEPGRGQEVYVMHCAQCHGATGTGGVVGAGTEAPAVRGLDPVAVAGATRVGPFEMPPFPPETIDDDELDDLVAFLEPGAAPATPLGLTELNRVTAGAFALLLLAGAVLVAMWTGWPIRSLQPPEERHDH